MPRPALTLVRSFYAPPVESRWRKLFNCAWWLPFIAAWWLIAVELGGYLLLAALLLWLTFLACDLIARWLR